MNTKLLTLTLIGFLLISVMLVSMIIPSSDRAKEHAKAPEKSPVISANGAAVNGNLSKWILQVMQGLIESNVFYP